MSAGDAAIAQPAKQAIWPSVLGIIYVVLGSLAALGALLTPFFMWVMDMAAEHMPESESAIFNQYRQHMGALWAVSAAGLVLGLLVLLGGIFLVRRRAASRPILLLWALLKPVYGVLYAWLNYVTTVELGEAMANSEMAGPMAMMDLQPLAAGSSVFSALFYAALPIFTIIWFLRPKVREEVSRWRMRRSELS